MIDFVNGELIVLGGGKGGGELNEIKSSEDVFRFFRGLILIHKWLGEEL